MEDQIAVFPQTRGWLSKSVLEPVVQPYIEHLVARRYARSTVHAYVYDIAHFAHWMSNRHIDLDQFDETAIQMFIEQHLSRCNCPEPVRRQRCELRAALNQLLVVLRQLI